MRTTFFFFICGVLIVLGMLLYPTVHSMIAANDTTGWLPITVGAVTLLPYIFLAFVAYAIKRSR